MEKKAISIIALDPRAARSYGRDVEGLFGEVADVSVFSVMDGSAMGVLPHADLFAASTDAFGSPEDWPATCLSTVRPWRCRPPSAGRSCGG
mgnify:CR=1 FL=1